ncbi:MAG TPA: hypothetical protein VK211_08785 [Kamptonema sp.]|nr:hypothetical protein [Kamptonema sp.]
MSTTLIQSLEHLAAIGGLFSGAIGISFFFAGLKIKSEITVEVTKQLAEISISQLKSEFEDSRLAQILVELKGEIDINKAELTRQGDELNQVQGFLATQGYYRRGSNSEGEGDRNFDAH